MNPITALINRLRGFTAIQRVGQASGTLVRAFDIGRSGRRLAAIPSNVTEINNLIKTYGTRTVARSRYLCKNNAYAAAAKAAYVSALAGFGIKPSPLNLTPAEKEALQDLWGDYLPYADADGTQDHYGQQAMVAGELFEAGEIFAVFEEPRNAARLAADGVVPLKVRLLQSEMLPLLDNRPKLGGTGNYVEMGVEFNSSGERVAYHFLKKLPGNPVGVSYGTERIPAERVLHVFNPITPGQVRGIPRTLAGMVTLAMLDLYDDAELERKRTAALFAAFVTREAGDDSGDSALGTLVQNSEDKATFGLEPGAVIDLEEGESVEFAEPADVGGQYEAFQYRSLLKAAAGFGVPYTAFTGDLKAVNYSSIRAGLVEFRRRITAEQFNIMVFQFCRPIRNEWLDTAARWNLLPWGPAEYLARRVKLRRTKYLPPKWDWVDPLKDLQAEQLAVNAGFKDRADVIEEEGYDAEETDRRMFESRQRVQSYEEQLGGPLFAGSAPEVTPDPNAEDGASENEDLTAEINAYGVAVRAGAVTPQSEDEEHLREAMGLPPMSAEAKTAWENAGNVRTPITLTKPENVDPENLAPPPAPKKPATPPKE